MKKKLNRHFVTWAVWVLSCSLPLVTHADQQTSPDAKSLAIIDRVLEYCGPIDPAVAEGLREKIKRLTKGLSEQQVTQLRQTPEYQAAYSSMGEFVGKVDEHNARKLCTESVSQGK